LFSLRLLCSLLCTVRCFSQRKSVFESEETGAEPSLENSALFISESEAAQIDAKSILYQ
jgi:hypothetical protein